VLYFTGLSGLLALRQFSHRLLVGLAVGFAPIGYALFKRSKRFDKFQEGLPKRSI